MSDLIEEQIGGSPRPLDGFAEQQHVVGRDLEVQWALTMEDVDPILPEVEGVPVLRVLSKQSSQLLFFECEILNEGVLGDETELRACCDLIEMARSHLLSLANAHEQRCANTNAVDVMRQYARTAEILQARLTTILGK